MSFENDNGRESYRQYYLPTAEKILYGYDRGKKFLWSTNWNYLKTSDNIRKITRGLKINWNRFKQTRWWSKSNKTKLILLGF